MEELLDWIYNDDDPNYELLYGLRSNEANEDTISEYMMKLYSQNYLYKGFRICIKTSYKMIIPIGVGLVSKKEVNDTKAWINKMYISQTWRRAGYDSKAVAALADY